MKRIAVLIGSPLSESDPNHLSGVEYDIKNYYNFLLSSTGGAWTKDEIIYLENPTSYQLQKVKKECQIYDYAFVYYSGHGFYARNIDDQFLNINKKEKVSVKAFLNFTPKQITIFDACRVFADWSYFLGKIDTPTLIYDYNNPLKAKEFYSDRIKQIDKGQVVLFSTKKGDYSYEDKNNGGFFSSSILLVASKFAQDKKNSKILTINEAFEYSKEVIHNKYSILQTPEIIKSNSNALLFPFAVQPYQTVQNKLTSITPTLQKSEKSDNETLKWVLGGAAVIGLALLIGNAFKNNK